MYVVCGYVWWLSRKVCFVLEQQLEQSRHLVLIVVPKDEVVGGEGNVSMLTDVMESLGSGMTSSKPY